MYLYNGFRINKKETFRKILLSFKKYFNLHFVFSFSFSFFTLLYHFNARGLTISFMNLVHFSQFCFDIRSTNIRDYILFKPTIVSLII